MKIQVKNIVWCITRNSVYLLWEKEFMRLAKDPANRVLNTLEGPLGDGEWKPYQEVYLEELDGEWTLRILPPGRPEGSIGIITSDIKSIFESLNIDGKSFARAS